MTPLPAARPSALRTAPRPGRVELADEGRRPRPSSPPAERPRPRPSGRRPPRRPRGRTPSTSRAARPPRSGPEDRDPGRPQRIGDPGRRAAPPARRRPAPAACARASATTAAGSSGSTAAHADAAARRRSRRCPGATSTSFTPGSRPSFQASACSRPPPPRTRIRVGITSVIGGSHRLRPASSGGGASAATPARWSGSAPGPTETNTIGTPACSSSADT